MKRTESTCKGILFICTGNICRSPMAAGLSSKCGLGESGQIIRSAGTRGVDGQTAHPLALDYMDTRGIDLSSHRARTVTPALLTAFDLILTMELAHKTWIETRMPAVRGRVHLLGCWRNLEIVDPINGGRHDFERAAEQIEQCLVDWGHYIHQDIESSRIGETNSQAGHNH